MNLINKDDTFDKYDFSSIISDTDELRATEQIRRIIESGDYFENSPKFQTKVNLFSLTDDYWLKFRFSFIFSVFMYLGREVPISHLQAWSFMTNNEALENRNNLWHTHHYTDGKTTISGIYYLKVPEDADYSTSGTEFAPNGLEDSLRVQVAPSPKNWIIYPGKIWHRPTPPQSKDYRFIIAADMEF